MIVNGDLATMVAVIEFEILSFLVGRKIDLIYLYATILSLSFRLGLLYIFGSSIWMEFSRFQIQDR